MAAIKLLRAFPLVFMLMETPEKCIQGTYPNAFSNDEHLHSNLKQTAHKKYQFIFSFKTNYSRRDGVMRASQ